MKRSVLALLIITIILMEHLHLAHAQSRDVIVFTSDQDGDREIYTINPDGTNLKNLTNNSSEDREPAWSPNRQQIVFIAKRDGNLGVYTMNANGDDQKLISPADGSFYDSPVWSPDGQQIAFVSDRGGGLNIFIVGVGGDNLRAITTTGHGIENIEPDWSPDGSQIAYASTQAGYVNIYVISINNQQSRRLTTEESVDHYSPSWSPNGKEIAYTINGYDYSDIYTIAADGSNASLIVSTEGYYASSITWSPDANMLAYVVWKSGGNRSLRVVNINGTNVHQLTESSSNADYVYWNSPEPIQPISFSNVGNTSSNSQPTEDKSLRLARALENARAWSLPNVYQGEVMAEISLGTSLAIVDGTISGPIRLDSEIQGDWYLVKYPSSSSELGWVWSERLAFINEGTTTSIPSFERNLYVTDPRIYGDDVSQVQTRLGELGYDPGPIDGYYGPLSEAAVRLFQRSNQLEADGVVGILTWERLFNREAK